MKLSEGWMFSKVKLTDNANSLLNGGNKVLQSRHFVLMSANLKYCALSRDLSADRAMPRAEVRARAQASHGNIRELKHSRF